MKTYLTEEGIEVSGEGLDYLRPSRGDIEMIEEHDLYSALEWDEDDTAIVPLKKPGQPWWVRDDDLVRFHRLYFFKPAAEWGQTWNNAIAFQIKRRRVSAESQVLALLSVATDDEADAIRSAARRANIKVPE